MLDILNFFAILIAFVIPSLLLLYCIKRGIDYRKINKKNKFIVVPDGKNFEIWQLEKDAYLKTSIVKGVCSLISIPLAITAIFLIINDNQESQMEFLSTPKAIIFSCLLITISIHTIFFWQNRNICLRLFYNENFTQDVKLKKFNWFFQSKLRIVIFLSIPSAFVQMIFAIIIYKDIESNNANPIQTSDRSK
ncbi:MAG: hypothetical protein ACRDCH_01320 [Metamycoplasmataceae bacterium]